jgi:peptidoglycan-N-acetylglucosamine deacetylase
MVKAVIIKVIAIVGIIAVLRAGEAPESWLAAGVILLLALGWIAWGVFNVNSSMWAETAWRSFADTKNVALTFDDGPDPVYTPKILQVLDDKGVKAAFFCVGHRVIEHPEIVLEIKKRGHLIGNHSDSHAMWINFSLHKRLRREIRDTGAAIKSAAGVVPKLYRAPHGFKNPALGDVLAGEDMLAIGWQVRGFDAVSGNAARITQRVVNGAKAGGVILLHDGAGLQGSDDRSATVDALPVIIDGLRARGLSIVRLDELLELEPYHESKPTA